ncbi:hypothetical protein KI387_039785, partial [Taxus chinensis]
MAPKKPQTKRPEVEKEEPVEVYSEMQYPSSVIKTKKWSLKLYRCKINEYNHQTSDNEKLMWADLVSDTPTVDELRNPKVDNSVQQELQKTGVLQLWELSFFAKPTPLF